MFDRLNRAALWVLALGFSAFLAACGGSGGSDNSSTPAATYSDSDLDQAKKMFADLRSSVMSVSNKSKTGTLNIQFSALKEDFNSGVNVGNTFKGLYGMLKAYRINYQGMAEVSPYCGTIDANGSVTCTFTSDEISKEYSVVVTGAVGGNQASWTVTGVRDLETGESTVLSGLSGTIVASGDSFKLHGDFIPMTGDAAKTSVDVTVSASGEKDQEEWSGSGTFSAIKADGVTRTFTANITEALLDEVTNKGRVVASLIGPHQRFDGTIVLSGRLSSADGRINIPSSGSLTGAFTDISDPNNPVKFLEGTLTFTQDWTNYDPRQLSSDSNYRKISFGFDGTSYKSAGVVGLGLSLQIDNKAGFDKFGGSFSVKNNDGTFITGTMTPADGGEADMMITNGKGIQATYSSTTQTGSVTKGSTILGTLSSQRVTFSDGTFQSLI